MNDDSLLRERIQVKLKNREEGAEDPVPEEFTFDNQLKGVVVKRLMNPMMRLYEFEVRFRINGLLFEVKVPLTYELAMANRDEALTALYKAMAEALAASFMEEVGRTAISP
jgi:phosphoribosylformylglycinamidine (FGAM) synthase PurS component